VALAAGGVIAAGTLALGGGQLVVRQLGVPRSYRLGGFARLEVVTDVTTRAELSPVSEGAALEAVRTVAVPLPDSEEARARVVAALEAGLAGREENDEGT
jgi:hypothetical protein